MASKKYRDFFIDSPEGQHFVEILEGIIIQKYEKAEAKPDMARDMSQQAAGIREALNQIKVLSVVPKEKR